MIKGISFSKDIVAYTPNPDMDHHDENAYNISSHDSGLYRNYPENLNQQLSELFKNNLM